LIAAVKTSVVDFALATLSSRVIDDLEIAHTVILPRRSSRIFAGSSNPLTARRRVSPRDLVAGPWILPRRTDFYREKFASLFRNVELPEPQPAVEYDSLAMARRLLCEGPYMAYLSKAALYDEIERGLVKAINVPELKWENDNATGAFFRKAGTLSPSARTLLDLVGTLARALDR